MGKLDDVQFNNFFNSDFTNLLVWQNSQLSSLALKKKIEKL